MRVEDYITELKVSLRSYEKRDLIDEASIYKWIETALKKFGGDITIAAECVLDVKRGMARLPGSYFDLIYAYRCDFKGYEVPEGKEVIPRLQNTIAWKERTERSYRWCSCDECCKEECEKTIIEKFYINTPDGKPHEVRCHYDKPVLLRLAKPMLKDKCLGECRNKYVKDNPFEINIVNGYLYANFDGPVYMKYKSLPFDGEGEIEIPDTPQGLVFDYVDNYVRMKFFEEQTINGETPNAANLFQLYAQQDLLKLKNAKTEAKMMNFRLEDLKKPIRKNRAEIQAWDRSFPETGKHIKFI